MTNPFEQTRYDKDGLPIPNPYPQPAANPFTQPDTGFADPMAANMPQTPMPQYAPQFANLPASYGFNTPMVMAASQKSWIAAALLAFLFGPFGIHNFYLGYSRRGLVQLVTFIAGVFTAPFIVGILPMFAVALWTFIEMILIIVGASPYDKDGFNRPLPR
ncbi:TM2 domain-containing protein [Corynebacterium freiburgense]|uniref:TM2 domain-containing protein n=1 Tax=Corynebacterium freiburgense TaxID=556548 RepID=UPI0004046044|nr:TM2 domain-containing protein [Corynebacterium freiburgense]WJZ02520.1 TM2 domain protein [Corynebacterium freiburgense]